MEFLNDQDFIRAVRDYATRVRNSGGEWTFGWECSFDELDGWQTVKSARCYFVKAKGREWNAEPTKEGILSAWRQCAEHCESVA